MAASAVAGDNLIHNDLSNGSGQSLYACTYCRRSKIKCDRLLKECGSCVKASRACIYPLTVHKPGPKLGTHRRPAGYAGQSSDTSSVKLFSNRKRARLDSNDSQLSSLPSPSEIPVANKSNDLTSGYGASVDSSSPSHSSRVTTKSHTPFMRLVHPGHEPNESEISAEKPPTVPVTEFYPRFELACLDLGCSAGQGFELIQLYFETMTSFSLFHRPTFTRKLDQIIQPSHLLAFLSAIFSYALRFKDTSPLLRSLDISAHDLLNRSFRLQLQCLEDCLDEGPPLYLLQSYFLVVWQNLIRGVRAKTFRMVGDCVRLGIELRLNMVDAGSANIQSEVAHDTDSENWIDAEERRRMWWGLWELDIFTSTIRKLPNAIDDRLNFTLLPSTDEDWYSNNEAQSCFLSSDAAQRWQDVVRSGNKSPETWFVLINSYMYDGFCLSAFPKTWQERINFTDGASLMNDGESLIRGMRAFLEDCLSKAVSVLPQELSCSDRFLPFRAPTHNQHTSSRVMDCARYCIHIMRQLSRQSLYIGSINHGSMTSTQPNSILQSSSMNQIWKNLVDEAKSTASVIRASSPHHYRYVNPLISNAIWSAAASLIVAKLFGPTEFDAPSAQSDFELLVTTLNNFEAFWQTPSVLKTKLKGLEETLRHLRRRPPVVDSETIQKFSSRQQTPFENALQSQQSCIPASWPQEALVEPITTTEHSDDIFAGLDQIDWSTPGLFDFNAIPNLGFGQVEMLQATPFEMNYDGSASTQTDTFNLNGFFSYPY